MFGLWNKAKSFLQGLSKKHGVSGLFQKAKSVIGKGMDILRSKPVKGLVQGLSQYLPTAGTYYNDAKKYGSIVSNLMNGGAERKADRFVKRASDSIERQPRLPPRQDPFADPENGGGLFA